MTFETWITYAFACAVLSVIPGPSVLLITGQALAAKMSLANNLFWNDGNAFSVRWVEELTLNSGTQFNELPGRGKQGNQVAAPRFVNRPGLNFKLSSLSPAIDNANDDLLGLDTAYRNRFGHESSIPREKQR